MNSFPDSKHVFIVGIKGVAMAGIARILTQMGKKVDGSDTEEEQITDEQISKLKCHISKLTDVLPEDIDLVLYSAAHGGVESVQVKEARQRGIQVMSQGAFIADFLKMFPTSIAICGCHGKTGTSALMAYTLKQLGAKVSWLVGAPYFKGVLSPEYPVSDDGRKSSVKHDASDTLTSFSGGHYEEGSDIFVFEADEYGVAPPHDKTPKILLYFPTHILCTNIDFDHPDIFRDLAHVRKTFSEFFTHSKHVYDLNSHNLEQNSKGVVKCLMELGYEKKALQQAIKSFSGVARRLEYHGQVGGVDYFDDYGHHPAEIAVTIDYLRTEYEGRRLFVLFQAHTYSRTQALKNEFVDSLSRADMVLIDAIFPSAREKEGMTPISALDLEQLAKNKGFSNIKGFNDRDELVEYAKSNIHHGDVILTLGAGDIYKIVSELKSYSQLK